MLSAKSMTSNPYDVSGVRGRSSGVASLGSDRPRAVIFRSITAVTGSYRPSGEREKGHSAGVPGRCPGKKPAMFSQVRGFLIITTASLPDWPGPLVTQGHQALGCMIDTPLLSVTVGRPRILRTAPCRERGGHDPPPGVPPRCIPPVTAGGTGTHHAAAPGRGLAAMPGCSRVPTPCSLPHCHPTG